MILLTILFACQTHTNLTGILPLNAPSSITAGESVVITVGPVRVLDGTNVGLVMVSKHGPRIYSGTFEEGVAQFNIPGEHTLQSGYLAFIAASQDARGEIGMQLHPKPQIYHSMAEPNMTLSVLSYPVNFIDILISSTIGR